MSDAFPYFNREFDAQRRWRIGLTPEFDPSDLNSTSAVHGKPDRGSAWLAYTIARVLL